MTEDSSTPQPAAPPHRWRALRNWLNGLQFDPEPRSMCCGHPVPDHYGGCQYFSLGDEEGEAGAEPGESDADSWFSVRRDDRPATHQ